VTKLRDLDDKITCVASTRFLSYTCSVYCNRATSNSYKRAAVGNLKQPYISPRNPHRHHRSASVAAPNKVSHRYYPHSAITPVSPSHLAALLIQMDSRSEDLLAKNRCTTLEKRTKQNRRMSFIARHLTMTTDWHNVM
jgi:hypothetical protein